MTLTTHHKQLRYPLPCRRCLEVKCDPGSVKDNYGGVFDRNHVCYDASESVIVQVVDDCPCNYPKNAYSNRRW